MEDSENVLGTGLGFDGLNRLGKAHRQNAALMEGLTQEGVVETQITRYRVNLPRRPGPDTVDGALDLVEQGQPITRIARIAMGHQIGNDKTGCWSAAMPGLLPNCTGQLLLPVSMGARVRS